MEESKATNLSQIKRKKMLETLKEIKQNISDEETLNNLSLIENELNEKKYGLIWEEHEERVDKELKTQIPVFENVADKEITSDENLKYNFLLEGDNLHSLYLLEKTHKNGIDVIYIDPPYNTGHRDFVYSDSTVERTDEFVHSKWLSFMSNRLSIAKRLLSPKGVIFISIDDNEGYQLKLLCDEIFGEENFISDIVWNSRKSVSNDAVVSLNHNYTLLYAKSINDFNGRKSDFKFKMSSDGFANPDNDPRGPWKADPFDAPAVRQNLSYEIINPNTGVSFLPPNGRHWRTEKSKYEQLLADNRILFGKTGNGKPQLKRFLDEVAERGATPKSIWDDCGTATDGTKEILDIFGSKVFDTPKPTTFIKKILELASYQSSIVLDFFAGSGTTAQAVMELNKEDGGNRQFILCTNNENDICEDITYQRIKTVITGNRQNGTRYSDGLNANLKYYKTSYVPRIDTEEENLHNNLLVNIKNLIQLENGINIDDKSIKIFLDEDEFDKMTADKDALDECDKVYISSDILMTSEQEKILENNNIDIFAIPEYYFKDEIVEVTE